MMARHEFTENVNDASMCLCGVPALGHDEVYRTPAPTAVRVLAKHQLATVLPGGVVCTCGAELAALNPPLDDGAVKGEPLALAVHQMQEMEAAR